MNYKLFEFFNRTNDDGVCMCVGGDFFEIFPDAAEKVLQLHCLFFPS